MHQWDTVDEVLNKSIHRRLDHGISIRATFVMLVMPVQGTNLQSILPLIYINTLYYLNMTDFDIFSNTSSNECVQYLPIICIQTTNE